MKTVGVISGGFDPIHKGHIAYIKAAKELCDYLVVGVNTDAWLERKKGKAFMPYEDRKAIIKGLNDVDNVIDFNDDDGSAYDLIYKCSERWGEIATIIFMNGGDRNAGNIPEEIKCKQTGLDEVEFMFGVGGEDKKNSSSWILEEWKSPKTERPWGWYRVLDTQKGWAVKELTIESGKSLSDQRHTHRSENWAVVSGEVHIAMEFPNGQKGLWVYKAGDVFQIPKKTWHKAYNNDSVPAKVVETWLGDILEEGDIERR